MNDALLARLLPPVKPVSVEDARRRLATADSVLLAAPHLRLGDLLAATPFFANLRRALPRARLVLAASPENAAAVGDSPDLDRTVEVPLTGPAVPVRTLAAARRLGREGFDAAILVPSLQPAGAATILVRGTRAGFTAGFPPAERSPADPPVLDCAVPLPDPVPGHVVDFPLALLEGLGVAVTAREHVLGVTPEQKTRAGELLAGLGIDTARPVLGVQPGGTARSPGTHWAPANYATVLQRAAAELGVQPLLLGRGGDAEVTAQIRDLGKSEVPELLDLSFADYKAVLSRLSFFLTQEGERVHVAAGVGTPSFFIFLTVPAWRAAPYGSHVAVWEDAGQPPSASEIWERMRPRLEAALAGPGEAAGR